MRASSVRPLFSAPEINSARKLIRLAITEDVGSGDITTRHFIPPGTRLKGTFIAKGAGVLCGLPVIVDVFRLLAPKARVSLLAKDGQTIRLGQKIARIAGPREILTGERIALNFIQHLSGIATLTRRYADELKGTSAKIYDTRKTLPGWRLLEKYAVRCGGGRNHRLGLYDAVMIKDNHLNSLGHSGVLRQIRNLRKTRPRIPLIMESKNRTETALALACAADIILLDNMPPARLKNEIRHIRSTNRHVQIEISGGVSLKTVRSLAKLGPDRISVGRITHSAPALDISLEIE